MRVKALILASALLSYAAPAKALLCGTVLDPMSVTATALNFGNYFPSSASAATMTVKINCGLLGVDLLPAFTLGLSAGNSGNPAARYLNRGGTHMNYNIYSTISYSRALGDGTAGTLLSSYAGLLSIGTISFTGYGNIPAGQYLPAGSYSDTIMVTVSY
jgi:spore coat protein U-like protein